MSLGHRFGHMAFSPPHSGPHCYSSTFARLFCCKCVARALEFHSIEALSAGQTAIGLDLPFIIVSSAISEETAVEAMKAGAHDYVMKGNLTRLVPAVKRELREAVVRRECQEVEAALRRARDELEMRVQERTADLAAANGALAEANAALQAEIAERKEAERISRSAQDRYRQWIVQIERLLEHGQEQQPAPRARRQLLLDRLQEIGGDLGLSL